MALDRLRAKLREFRYHVPARWWVEARFPDGSVWASTESLPEHGMVVRGIMINPEYKDTRLTRLLQRWHPSHGALVEVRLRDQPVFLTPVPLITVSPDVMRFIRPMAVRNFRDLDVRCYVEGPLACLANALAGWRVKVCATGNAIPKPMRYNEYLKSQGLKPYRAGKRSRVRTKPTKKRRG